MKTDQKRALLAIRVTIDQLRWIERGAARDHVTMAEWVRQLFERERTREAEGG